MDVAVYCFVDGGNWQELRYPDGHPEHPNSIDMAFVLTSSQCYTGPDYSEWLSVGNPVEWCELRQCHGDTDTAKEYWGGKTGTAENAWVGYNDLTVLLDTWRDDADIDFTWAADADHAAEYWGGKTGTAENARIGYNDLAVLLYWWRGNNGVVPDDCLTGTPAANQ